MRATMRSAACLLALSAPLARAGTFFEKDGLAIGGYDPVTYFTQAKPSLGLAAYSLSYQGSEFRFVSAADRDAFTADRGKYVPQYHGFCAFGVAEGAKAPADPTAYSVYHDKLYFNYSPAVATKFATDLPGYVDRADHNWPKVQNQPLEK